MELRSGWDKVNRGRWQKVRLHILERDRYVCQIRLPGCTTRATQVDHVTRIDDGGMIYEPMNLRAACQPCNLARERHTPVVSSYSTTRW